MELNRRQSQFELFPSTSENLAQSKNSGYKFKDLTLSLENIIVACIILVMVLVLSFSFGVEKGRDFNRVKEMRSPASQDSAQVKEGPSKLQIQTVKTVNSTASAGKLAVQPAKPEVKTSEKLPLVDQNLQSAENPKGLTDQPKSVPQRNLQEDLIGRYTIQVASFKQKGRAVEEAQKLTSKGHKIFVVPKGSHSIVCVGNFSQKKEAEKFLNKFKKKYGDSLVRRF